MKMILGIVGLFIGLTATANADVISGAPPIPTTITGNAGTATALAANGANCAANSYPLGVDASGAAESCGTAISGNAGTATALAANGANCPAGQYPLGVDASGAVESCTASTGVAASDSPTWTGTHYYAGAVNFSSANANIVSGASVTVNGLLTMSNAELVGGGLLRQVVSSTTANFFTAQGAAIPFDDSIPQITEGYQVLSATVTPKNSTSNIEIDIGLFVCEPSDTCTQGAVSVYQDATANAVCTSGHNVNLTAAIPSTWVLKCKTTAASTTARVYSVRVGCNGANSLAVNGCSSRLYGGAAISWMHVREVAP